MSVSKTGVDSTTLLVGPSQYLMLTMAGHGTDGFFAAIMERAPKTGHVRNELN